MNCRHCGEEIVQNGAGDWIHARGMYGCHGGKPRNPVTYAEPSEGEPMPLCACRKAAKGQCDSCAESLCSQCDSGEYQDVMVCVDKAGCEARMRRKAVGSRMQDMFSEGA